MTVSGTLSKTIDVDLGERSYPVVIGRDLLGGAYELAAHVAGSSCFIVSNDTVAPLYLEALTENLGAKAVDSVVLPDGEAHKTLRTLSRVLDALVSARASRDTTLIALGGGVVGDIAGFAASCYMRGVGFIQVPTTLLAQVDSSVGGKTGVNHPEGKNLIGAFYQPQCVLIDTATLDTLPDRELSAGLAEVIKYGAIADAGFLDWLDAHMERLVDRDSNALAHAISRSCELKAQIVAEDEREAGRRAILNFGHTFGHAIERCQGYGDWLHGEAVAAGMLMAAELSGLTAADVARLRELIRRARLPVEPPAIDADAMLEAMGLDKKAVGSQLRFVLLDEPGAARLRADYDEDRLARVLETGA